MSIDMMTPAMAGHFEGEITKCWISHREEAIKKKALEIPENRLPLSTVQGYPSSQPLNEIRHGKQLETGIKTKVKPESTSFGTTQSEST